MSPFIKLNCNYSPYLFQSYDCLGFRTSVRIYYILDSSYQWGGGSTITGLVPTLDLGVFTRGHCHLGWSHGDYQNMSCWFNVKMVEEKGK